MFVVLPETLEITGKLSYKLLDNFKKIQKREYSSKSESVKLLTREEVRAIIKSGKAFKIKEEKLTLEKMKKREMLKNA